MSKSEHTLMILVAGHYRSGTGDDPRLIARNMRALDEAALAAIPGECFALPLIEGAAA